MEARPSSAQRSETETAVCPASTDHPPTIWGMSPIAHALLKALLLDTSRSDRERQALLSALAAAPGILCNAKKPQALGYSLWVIKGVRRAGEAFGDNPFFGRFAYPEDIEAWLRRHPDFVASRVLRSKLPPIAKYVPVKATLSSAVTDHHAGIDEAPPSPQPEQPERAAPRPSRSYGLLKVPRKRPARRNAAISPTPEWQSCRERIIGRRHVGKDSMGTS